MRIANLGMYDMPSVQPANDALWAGVAARLQAAGFPDVPAALDRTQPLQQIWHSDGLLLSQTCGYPLTTTLNHAVQVVAAPVYGFPGCSGARHCSFLVVPESAEWRVLDDLRGQRAAINARDSNTGMNLFRAAVAALAGGRPFFSEVIETGSHLASLAAVAANKADIAAVDCVTYALARRYRPDLVAGVRILGETLPSPTLPFITHAQATPADTVALRAALADTIADPAMAQAMQALGLLGVVPATAADYEIIGRYERAAIAAGYLALA